MAFNVWQTSLQDQQGNAVSGATVTVTDSETGQPATLYADRDGNSTLSNPFTTGVNGLVRFYAASGFYQIDAVKDGDTASFQWENVGDYALRSDFEKAMPAASRVANAMWSWWTSPLLVNDGRYTYSAPTRSFSQLALSMQDNLTGEVVATTVDLSNFSNDDHNAGSIVSDGENVLAMYAGRRHSTDSAAMYYTEFQSGTLPGVGLTKLSNSANNYPSLHKVGDQFLMFGRATQNAGVPQWTYRISDWPLTTWGTEKTLFQSSFSWPYIASRRSRVDPHRIILGLAWHPLNSDSDGSLRYGYIQRVSNGTGDWNFFDGTGSDAKGGLTTDYLMPLSESDFDVIYTPTASEKLRLLSISDETALFCVWTQADFSDGMYKYARKVSGTWVVNDVVASGRFMNQQSTVGYPLGGCIGFEPDVIHICRESSGIYFYERKRTTDNGSTWSNEKQVRMNYTRWQDIIVARPLTEELQDHNWSQDRSKLKTLAVYGYYDEQNYQAFATDIVSESWLETELQQRPFESLNMPISAVFDTSGRTLDLTDSNKELTMTSGSAETYTVDTAANVPFVLGTKIRFYCNGASTTVDFASGVNISGFNSGGTFVTQDGGSFTLDAGDDAEITNVGSNAWRVVGNHNGVTA